MSRFSLMIALAVSLMFLAAPVTADAANPGIPVLLAKNACNPCAKNPCAANPCAKNACNPCGGDEPKPIRSKHITDYGKLVKMGQALWSSSKLGGNDFSCKSCHDDHEDLNLGKHKGQWPHHVKMANDIVTLDQMINFCMINPMESKPLDPNGIKMTALAAFYKEYAKSYKGGMNACNPCAANPCAKKNPCNPCGK